MPGGRLTHDDRRRIAAWLADGLGYAEIGRRLGRPTSTISREVTRNGTAGDYVPDRAQRAAGERARRRRPRPTPPAVEERPAEAARGFVEELATLLAATGLPRTTARVFVRLLTADAGGLTAADLVRLLGVSPASVSMSTGHLEGMGLVARRPDPGGRRARYVVDDDAWARAWRADTGTHDELAAAARRGVEVLGADTTAGARLDRMGRFFARLSEQMSGSAVAETVVHDALTVLAALVHAGRPLTPGALAAALGWSGDRVLAALEAIRRRPVIADPFAVRATEAGAYTFTTRPDRLSPEQRAAIGE
ncbi:GbsR/MarR family transcriptional regulator [Saccharothrix australiensis]|uniref:MarR family protein n=1 Tax=Saccharothrix australiensis TaxID=2072 RepID=A0A495VU10_9PSEU|nr:MarR family transcriptional regulator [Saccharothrix australiensis]RKT52812.1 MarR family protein [Saccharothrix australiensis]